MKIEIGLGVVKKDANHYDQDKDGARYTRLNIPVAFAVSDGLKLDTNELDPKAIARWFDNPLATKAEIRTPKDATFQVEFWAMDSRRKSPVLVLSQAAVGRIKLARKNDAPLGGTVTISVKAEAEAASEYLHDNKGFSGRITLAAEQKTIDEA